MIRKTATLEVLAAAVARPQDTFVRTAHRAHFDYTPRPGFLYVRSRAISSRCNDNFDEFPAEDIKLAYHTFIGKPVFVNHNNSNHRRGRGVCVDAALHEDVNPDGSPDTWVEVLMEVDAVRFPKLAQAILAGDIARTSMGCDVEYSLCSFCGNKARTPLEYCGHIPALKGQRIRRRAASGVGTEDVLVREICHGLLFFENSLLVEPPADPTAYFLGVDDRGMQMSAQSALRIVSVTESCPQCGGKGAYPYIVPTNGVNEMRDCSFCDGTGSYEVYERKSRAAGQWGASLHTTASIKHAIDGDAVIVPPEVDTLRAIKCPAGFAENDAACGFDGTECAVCGYVEPLDEFDDPDTSKAKELDRENPDEDEEDPEEETDMTTTEQQTPRKLSTLGRIEALRRAFIEQGRAYEAALNERDTLIATQGSKIAALGRAVEFLAAESGNTRKLAAHLGMIKSADIDNPAQPIPAPPEQAATTTTELERDHGTPVDLFAPGGVPGTGVGNAVPTDPTTLDGTMAAPAPDATPDVAAPIAGTQPGEVPLSDVRIETDVRTGPDPASVPVFTGSRTMAAIHLARLRIESDIVAPDTDDLILGNEIEQSDMSNDALQGEIATLSKVVQAKRTAAVRAQSGRRDLVPRLASGGDNRQSPSLAPGSTSSASPFGGGITDDEMAFVD